MDRRLVISQSQSDHVSRSALARSEAERLRKDAENAADGTLLMHADRLRQIADLLESLARRERSCARSGAAAAISGPPADWQPLNRVEQDLAMLMMRSIARNSKN